MTQENATEAALALAPGTWQVDGDGSEVGFKVRTFWGAVPVKGVFERFEGSFDVREDGASGELRIEAASLNTHNKTRDKHLRSADFFDVAQYPEITFSPSSVLQRSGGLTISGALTVGTSSLPLQLEAAVEGDDATRAKLSTHTRIQRAQAGMTWNRVGMIAGEADLHVELALTRR